MQGGEHQGRGGELDEAVGEGLGVVGEVDGAQRADLGRLAPVAEPFRVVGGEFGPHVEVHELQVRSRGDLRIQAPGRPVSEDPHGRAGGHRDDGDGQRRPGMGQALAGVVGHQLRQGLRDRGEHHRRADAGQQLADDDRQGHAPVDAPGQAGRLDHGRGNAPGHVPQGGVVHRPTVLAPVVVELRRRRGLLCARPRGRE
ncbi:hypothetical protein ABZZ17_19415 [Streptomyces sp. NPDC006512]|uniref:hypothetical protein n=1 Tax=Streptomyces sp. NPDC006512 TaxID=3154307 RepID=UPI0033A09093